MELVIITAARNAAQNMDALCASIDEQSDDRWRHIIIDDASDEGKRVDPGYAGERREVRTNAERRWALRNIVDAAREFQDRDDVIVATVDGDDMLCDRNTVRLVLNAYEQHDDLDVLWTAHKWDINEKMNVSQEMPEHVDPYEWPWCASHLRTWRANVLKQVPDSNFVNHRGEWFKRGYDQILMLPLMHVGRRRGYLNHVCYQYNMDSASIPLADRGGTEVEQIHNIAYVRARGFVGDMEAAR